MAKKQTKKTLIKTLVGYGYHVWVILFLANVLLIYSFQFYLRAASPQIGTTQVNPSQAPTATPTKFPTATPTPVGPVISVEFSVPGIGTNGANVKPLHPKRNLSILLYAPDVNSADRKVKPLYQLTDQVIYDADPTSPTHTKFINHHLDLGETVKISRYQVVFKMDQTLTKLVKQKERDVGGQLISLSDVVATEIAPQTFIVGDIYNPPHGDNIMDGKDHEMLLNCFGTKANYSSCLNKQNADLNDDGVVDGTDYNIMLSSFRTLKAMGFPVPSLSVNTPTIPFNPQISKKPAQPKPKKVSPSPTPAQSSGGGGGAVAVIFILLLLIGGGAGGFIAYKKGLLQKFINPSPKTPPPAEGQTEGDGTDDTTDQVASEAPAETGETTQTEEATIPGTQTPSAENPPSPEAPAPQESDPSAPPADLPIVDGVDNEFYVKKGKADDAKKGTWLVLTDDNGPIDAFYPGTDVAEGFAHVKGTKKIEGEKTYIDISELTPEA